MNTTFQPTETSPITETSLHCPLCGESLPANAAECTKCDWVPGYQENELELDNYDRRDVAAAIISVLPGAGHILKGHLPTGILIMAGIPVVVVFAFAFTMFFGWLLIPTYWIGVAMDAYYRPDLRGLAGMKPDVVNGGHILRHNH